MPGDLSETVDADVRVAVGKRGQIVHIAREEDSRSAENGFGDDQSIYRSVAYSRSRQEPSRLPGDGRCYRRDIAHGVDYPVDGGISRATPSRFRDNDGGDYNQRPLPDRAGYERLGDRIACGQRDDRATVED